MIPFRLWELADLRPARGAVLAIFISINGCGTVEPPDFSAQQPITVPYGDSARILWRHKSGEFGGDFPRRVAQLIETIVNTCADGRRIREDDKSEGDTIFWVGSEYFLEVFGDHMIHVRVRAGSRYLAYKPDQKIRIAIRALLVDILGNDPTFEPPDFPKE